MGNDELLIIMGAFILASLVIGIISLVLISSHKRIYDKDAEFFEESIEFFEGSINNLSETVLRISIKQLIYDYSLLSNYQETLIEAENFEEAAIIKSDMAKIKSAIRISLTRLPAEEAAEYDYFLNSK